MRQKKWKIAQQAEWRWWKNYLSKKEVHEYLEWKNAYWKETFLVQTWFPELDAKDLILDAGCGPAGINIALNDYSVEAIDPLLDKYEKELDHFEPTDYPWVNFHNTDLENFKTVNSFDHIFCINVINHVRDIKKAIQNLFMHLKPEGTLIITTDSHRNSFLKHLFNLLPGDILHPWQMNATEYIDLFVQAGFLLEKNLILKKERIFNYQLFLLKKPA